MDEKRHVSKYGGKVMVGNRRPRFPEGAVPARNRSKGFARSGGKGGVNQFIGVSGNTNPAGRQNFGRSGGKGGGSFKQGDQRPRQRQPQNPTNPHDPKSKDPFMRAGIGLGTNDTKIFTRAGMSMDLKKMRKMFG